MRQARIYRGVMYDTSSIERVLLNVVVRDKNVEKTINAIQASLSAPVALSMARFISFVTASRWSSADGRVATAPTKTATMATSSSLAMVSPALWWLLCGSSVVSSSVPLWAVEGASSVLAA